MSPKNVKMKSSDDPKTGQKKKVHPVNADLLDTFWGLSVEDENTRFNACEKLIEILQKTTEEENKDEEGQNKELMYTLQRLVRGLASNRQWACPGYAMALTQVLRTFSSISTSHLLKISDSEFTAAAKDTKQDRAGILRAQIMVYLCLVQSDIIKKATNFDVENVMKGLLEIKQQKVFLQQLCIHTIGQVSAKVSKKTFVQVILPLLNEELMLGWENCNSADSLLLLILIRRAHPTVINEKFLIEHWNGSSILVEHNFKHLTEILMNSSSKPPMHSVCSEILKIALQSDIFDKFWKSVVGSMISHTHVKNKHLALQMVSHVLNLNPTAHQMKTILKPEIRDIIVTNIASSKLVLHPVAKKLNEDILRFVREEANLDVQKVVLKCLLHGNVQYDSITQTRTIHRIVLALKPDAAHWFSEKCMEFFYNVNIFGEQKSEVSDVQIWAGSQLTLLCNHLSIVQQRKVIKFLFLHSFFVVDAPSSKIQHCDKIIPSKMTSNSKFQQLLKGQFTKGLHSMISVHHQGEGQLEHFKNNMDSLFDIIQYSQELFNSQSIVTSRKQWTDEAKDEWQKMYEAVKKIHSKIEHEKTINDNHAFGMLFLHLGLQLFADEQHAIDGLQDLHICYQKAFHKRRKSVAKNETDGQEWIDVITDLFLSLLALNSNLIRNAVNNVFGLLSSHMTVSSVKLILDVLITDKPDEEDDGVLAFEEDVNDDSGNENESLLSDPSSASMDDTSESTKDEDVDDESDENDSDVSEDSDIEEDIDVNFRETVKAALGSAAADSEKEDSEEENDLDDEAMFRVDDALAEAFRSMAKGKRKKDEEERKQQIMQFKMRCLDLLLMQLKNNETSPSVLLEMVIPLLKLIGDSAKDITLKKLCEKSTNVFRHLCKHKTIPKLSHEDRDQISSMIKELLTPSNLPPYEISNACAFLIKLLSQSHENAKTRGQEKKRDGEVLDINIHHTEVVEVLRVALKDFMEKRDSNLNHLLFTRMMSSHPIFLWPLSDDLLSYITNTDVRWFCRTQACTMLNSMVNKTVMEAMKMKWKNFFCELSKQVNTALEEFVKESEMKPKYLVELLGCYLRTAHATVKSDIVLELSDDVKSNVEKLKLKPALKKDVRKICDRILKLPESLCDSKRKRKFSQTDDSNCDSQTAANQSPTSDKDIVITAPRSTKKNRKRNAEKLNTPCPGEEKDSTGNSEVSNEQDVLLESPMSIETSVTLNKTKTPKSSKKNKNTGLKIENGENDSEITAKTPKSSKKKHKMKADKSLLETPSPSDLPNGGIACISVKTPKSEKLTKTPKSVKTETPKSEDNGNGVQKTPTIRTPRSARLPKTPKSSKKVKC